MSRIVVGVDGSTQADRALHWAVREAHLHAAEVELVLGYVIQVRGYITGRTDRELATDRLDAIIERNRGLLDQVKWSDTVVGVVGTLSGALTDVGEDAELIVVGSRGTDGFRGLTVGSTGYRTAAHASTPVAVIHGDQEARAADGSRPVVVGVDGSRGSGRALRWALDEAARRGVDATVVHGYHSPAEPAALAALPAEQIRVYRQRAQRGALDLVAKTITEAGGSGQVTVHQVAESGTPAGVLLAHAGPDRLLVVGTHGRGMLGRSMFGSVSHQVLHHATGPVVIVP